MINWVPNKKINKLRIDELLQQSIESNKFTNYGPCVKLLEELTHKLLKLDETKKVICVSNGAAALSACVATFEYKCGRKLNFVTQSFTFPASAQGYLSNVEIIDIDKEGGLDITQIPSSCDGIIVTNIFGNVVNIDKYTKWCAENNKILIFDNAATSYTFYKEKNSCNYGNASIVSFHHTKPIGFGEGGCIIIDAEYENYTRQIINFGFDAKLSIKWNRLGSNYKMSDIQAAYIISYFETLNDIVSHHRELYLYMKTKINDKIKLFPNFSDNVPFLSCFCILIKNSEQCIQELLKQNIFSRKYYVSLTNTPVSNEFYENIVCIPCTIDMKFTDIDQIIHILTKYG